MQSQFSVFIAYLHCLSFRRNLIFDLNLRIKIYYYQMENNNKGFFLILFLGFLTPIMMLFFPVEGGGVSLIFVLTVPILIGISIVFSIIYFYLNKWKFTSGSKSIFLFLLCAILVGLAFLLYPYRQN